MFTRRCVLFLCAACALPAQTARIDRAEIETSAKAELKAGNIPGAAIGIVENGRLIYAQGFGTRNLETGEPVTPQTLFRLGSTTKMMTAAAVASLAAEGKLDFADAVGSHIPGLDPAIAALTVNQILSHTSGLKDEAVMNGRHDDAALGEEIRRWKSDWLFTRPGAIYSYSNPGFWLAGFLAESIAGKPYADMMAERIFGPAGMSSTTVRPTMAMTRTLSQGHDMVDGRLSVLRPAPDNAANWPAGSVFSNLEDLAHFVTALMNDGSLDGRQVFSPKVVAALTTAHTDIPGSKARYGYGLEIGQTGDHLATWSHSGSRAGFGSFILMLPGRQQALIVLCNRTGVSLSRTRSRIMGMLAGLSPGERTSLAQVGSDPRYVGKYRNGTATHEIVAIDGKLLLDGQAVQLDIRDGWLISIGAPSLRAFPVAGPDGRAAYLFMGGRAAARVE